MPSPFAGMDPFIESQEWEDFHPHFIEDVHNSLVPRVRPRYVVRVEKRAYMEREVESLQRMIRPDVSLLREPAGMFDQSPSADAASTAVEPVERTLPIPEEMWEAYLTVRERETLRVVTVVEVLSPGNKRPGSDGRREYLKKREIVLQSPTHLVEIDLLRGGARLPVIESLPLADFYAFLSRARRRPRAMVYPWTLRQPLPTIPIPLAGDDPDVMLQLQAVFTSTYDRAGYDYSLRYELPIEPPLGESDLVWVQECLHSRNKLS